MKDAISIVLVDDHEMVRQGLRLVLEENTHLRVVGEAESGEAALPLCTRLQPDVILLDVHMPQGMDGITAAAHLKQLCPSTRVIILTMFDDEVHVERMLQSGVDGVVFKRDAVAELVQAIDFVADVPYLPQGLSAPTKERLYKSLRGERPAQPLTPRETEVLTLIARGYTSREIGERLFIGIKTVETHRKHIMDRLGVSTRADLMTVARSMGLTPAE
ncbi:MAG: response regulator transcription factor [Firmicutes bacterium]|nr:response regulator transcription factor [Bacillota bacterium]